MSAIEKVGDKATTEPDPRINDRIDPGADINQATIPGLDENILDTLGEIHKKASDLIAKHRAYLNRRMMQKQEEKGP